VYGCDGSYAFLFAFLLPLQQKHQLEDEQENLLNYEQKMKSNRLTPILLGGDVISVQLFQLLS